MFMKWKFFDKIPVEGGVSYQDLAASVGAQGEIVSRMGQMLVSTGTLLQPKPGSVAHSRLSLRYKTGNSNGSAFAMLYDDFQPVFAKLPGFFGKYGPNLPVGKTNIPITFASGADGKLTPWEVFAQQGTEHIEQFGLAMQAMTGYLWPHTGAYDFTWVGKYAATNPNRTLIIDVGGSFGHSLRANLVKYPNIPPGRCAVEDREEMIPSITKAHANDPVMENVQKVAADFHKEQPVKGALIYFIRRCLHDYDDNDCVNILKILADSLPEDEPQARVLINEHIMTDPPDREVAAIDIIMMTWASLERTVQQLEKLADRAGLVVIKVHRAGGSSLGVLECKKASRS
ncbi:S-adenosyl-L-methionine-dependent methyltransferase [Annulohypoxylon truncatum]|uniref:S-adenosyl-L-methionine-dependent methyltransferase n=1 Tax=Annulohypoxylon truncatum TaxID=327061 RepID=UPI002007FF5E|nr:S-adenosyl-L-methionine-dependent methyltransferase [Annulohypoxylon truncatum]KAI1209954.1 S-adenosyl-L-methionine-dependent methyltransferase [Annulohypoxylon truncatum]